MDNPHVDLTEPIKRGDNIIERVYLRRPQAGEMRGISIVDLCRMEATAAMTLLPRISSPPLSVQEVSALDIFDIGEFAANIQAMVTDRPLRPGAEQETTTTTAPSPETSLTPPPTSPSPSDGDPAPSGSSKSRNSSDGGDKQEKS